VLIAESGGCSSIGRAPALQAGGHRFDPGQLHQITGNSDRNRQEAKLPNAGRQTDTVIIIYFTVTRNVVLAPNIEQVRRAAIVQLHLTLSESRKVKPARVKPEAEISP
jgi:hypothetical protein